MLATKVASGFIKEEKIFIEKSLKSVDLSLGLLYTNACP